MNDDQKHSSANSADEEIADEASPLGHATEDVEDIDATLKSVGLSSDENGPKELNLDEDLRKTEIEHQKED